MQSAAQDGQAGQTKSKKKRRNNNRKKIDAMNMFMLNLCGEGPQHQNKSGGANRQGNQKRHQNDEKTQGQGSRAQAKDSQK